MIPRDYVTRWRAHAPWAIDAQVEQDLVISRALVELFRIPGVAGRLAFRGGTALYKLHVTPPPRYSEDIDLVQVVPEPIGGTLDRMRSVLDPWLGKPLRTTLGGSRNRKNKMGIAPDVGNPSSAAQPPQSRSATRRSANRVHPNPPTCSSSYVRW